MLQPEILNQTLPTGPKVPEASSARHIQAVSSISPLHPIHAKIEMALEDGRFLIRIAGRQVAAHLPPGTKVGEEMELRLVARSPEPRFVPFTQSAQSESTSLSPAGRVVALLEQIPASARPIRTNPLLTTQAMQSDPAPIAQQLREGISKSGVFYESHLLQWLNGKKPLEQLRQEPQAALAPLTPPTNDGASTPGEAKTTAQTVLPVHVDALLLVRQQLDAIEQRQITWQGEIWPGQTMDWDITEHPQHNRSDNDEDPPEWETRLGMDMPKMGKLNANIQIAKNGIRITLNADQPRTAELMRIHLPELTQAMEADALKILDISVKRHE